MTEHSLPPEALRRFLAGTSGPEERREVTRHLLQGCTTCATFFHGVINPRPSSLPAIGPSYDRAFEKAQQIVAHGSGTLAEPQRLFHDLLTHPIPRQEMMVRNNSKYHNIEFCELLINKSYGVRFTDQVDMQRLAWFAVLTAEQLQPKRASTELIVDHRARAWMAFGNSLRASGELNSAENALLKASRYLEQIDASTRSLSLRADLLAHFSSLRFNQRSLESSLSFAQQEIALRRDLYAPADVARSLLRHALSLGEGGDTARALESLAEAEKIAQRARDPRLDLMIRHCTIRFNLDEGRLDRALHLYLTAEPHYRRVQDPLIQAKATWLKGQILMAADQLDEALDLLQTTRRFFLERANYLEAAVASLDLGVLLLKIGRKEEVRRLATTAVSAFRARGVGRDYMAAYLLLRKAS